MQIEKVTDKAIEHKYPREAFFNKFPVKVVCQTCKTEITLDTPEDVRYNGANEYSGAYLSWSCPMCKHSHKFSSDPVVVRGYKQYFPNWWRDNCGWVLPLGFLVMLFSPLIVLAITELM